MCLAFDEWYELYRVEITKELNQQFNVASIPFDIEYIEQRYMQYVEEQEYKFSIDDLQRYCGLLTDSKDE